METKGYGSIHSLVSAAAAQQLFPAAIATIFSQIRLGNCCNLKNLLQLLWATKA
jgi:hypothetical protein